MRCSEYDIVKGTYYAECNILSVRFNLLINITCIPVGSLFRKSESEETFAFPFPSESTSHAFGDGKDDFSFPFAFGQDQRSSQSPPMKGFHSSLQNTKPFTFF